jgi:4-amino-4-deoxy-L-arabinose transferase-like glycosyltransferase
VDSLEDDKMIKVIEKQWAIISIIVITLCGLGFRLFQLTKQQLNIDESTTAWIANHTSAYIISYSLGQDNNPPLYYLFAHWSSVLLGGYSVFSVRIPAVIFGTLAIPVIFLIGKEIKNETLGILLASLTSFIYPFCWYSQDARAYSLVLLAFAGFTYFFVKIYRGDRNRNYIVGLSIFAALCLWSHFYSLLPIVLAGIILMGKDRVSTIYAMICTVILLAPMAIFFGVNQVWFRTGGQFGNPFWHPWNYVALWLPNELFGLSGMILIPLIVYALLNKTKEELLYYFGLIGGITVMELLPLALITNISPRYALLIAPMLIVVALYPVSEWIDDQKTALQKIALFMGVVSLFFIINLGSIPPWV